MLDIIEESDVNKLSFRKSGKRFLLYQKAIEPHIEKIKENIAKSENGSYRIGEKTLRDMLGEHLIDNKIETIRYALRSIFWKNDIIVETSPRVDGKKDFYFRRRTKSDVVTVQPE